ncbi:hypothetical protein [Mycolicibacterium insubricum]|uniref:hypothetical protein n=1 Tax=Mycolicibacterium insubricum TaxID=444597 RepID=UPI0021F2C44B|nr:hypothetical protein [Mycolicibacterium insubricum]
MAGYRGEGGVGAGGELVAEVDATEVVAVVAVGDDPALASAFEVVRRGDRDVVGQGRGLPSVEGGSGVCAVAAWLPCAGGVRVAEPRRWGVGVCVGDRSRW